MSNWPKAGKTERNKPKWIKRGTKVLVDAKVPPKAVKVTGKYGEREVYIIETKEYGQVYVNNMQIIHISQVLEDVFGDKPYNEFVTVEL